MTVYSKDYGVIFDTGSSSLFVETKRIKCDEYAYYVSAERGGRVYRLTRCDTERAAQALIDRLALEIANNARFVMLFGGNLADSRN